METNAKIALWEGYVAILVDAHTYETIMAARTGGSVSVELAVVSDRLMVGVTPRSGSPWTVSPFLKQSLPYGVRVATKHFSTEVCDHLARFGLLKFELSGSRSGLSGEIDLAPHLRPWPKLRPCKAYDYRERSVEVYKERILSCALAGDVWSVPPRDFMDKCPKSFMTIWGEMPEGLELRMDDGNVHRR